MNTFPPIVTPVVQTQTSPSLCPKEFACYFSAQRGVRRIISCKLLSRLKKCAKYYCLHEVNPYSSQLSTNHSHCDKRVILCNKLVAPQLEQQATPSILPLTRAPCKQTCFKVKHISVQYFNSCSPMLFSPFRQRAECASTLWRAKIKWCLPELCLCKEGTTLLDYETQLTSG